MPNSTRNLENLILTKLIEKKLITPDHAVSKNLRVAVLKMSDAFTRERSSLPVNYFDHELNRLAYVAGFVLTNAAKVTSCLEQAIPHLPKEGPLSILDVGSGPGTAVFAASSVFSSRNVKFTALEKNRYILQEASVLEKILPGRHSVDWLIGGAEKIPDKQYDLIIAANVLNELDAQRQLKTLRGLLSAGKVVVLIDPALKQTARDLMTLRDQVVDNSQAFVIAPCTHQKKCPMLADNKRDWCHFYIEWRRPKLIEALDNATGLDHRYLKMGYMILQGPKTKNPELSFFRVVSAPLKTKGKLELFVCGNGEIKRLRRQDKNSSETNSDFGSAKRGDIVSFTEKERPGEIRAFDCFNIKTAFTPRPSSL